MGKRFYVMTFLFIACAVCSFAKSLSFQIVQHNDSLHDVCKATMIIEDEILNSFFERGFIVSNEPAVVSDSVGKDEKFYRDGFNEAANGALDTFVQIRLYFTGDEQDNYRANLGNIKKIEWKIASVRNGTVIEDSSSTVNARVKQDEEANVREFANDFAIHLFKKLTQKA